MKGKKNREKQGLCADKNYFHVILHDSALCLLSFLIAFYIDCLICCHEDTLKEIQYFYLHEF